MTSRPPPQTARCCNACKAAGAVLVGALNMDEYAYGFTTENSHEGPPATRTTRAAAPGLVGWLERQRGGPARCR